MCLFPGFHRIKEKKGIILIINLIHETNQISNDFSAFFVVDPADRLVARVRDLLRIFGKLYLWNEFSCFFIHDSGELVYAAEGWTVLGGNQVGSHTPGIDGGSLDF